MKLIKTLTATQKETLMEYMYSGESIEDVRKTAAEYLISEGFDKEDVLDKVVNPKEVVVTRLRATNIWCVMFPWFC